MNPTDAAAARITHEKTLGSGTTLCIYRTTPWKYLGKEVDAMNASSKHGRAAAE
jgi:hypothetical protein